MIAVDYIILAILVLSAIMGLVRGLLRESIAVITWFLAIVLSWSFASSLEPHLGGVLVGSPLRIWAARVIIFVGVLLLGGGLSSASSAASSSSAPLRSPCRRCAWTRTSPGSAPS